tara:strand:+ start:51473 stop:51676 length:204 start_codon:yes stop_codon:yes gene_type:complete
LGVRIEVSCCKLKNRGITPKSEEKGGISLLPILRSMMPVLKNGMALWVCENYVVNRLNELNSWLFSF